ncbi:hypothetical protein DA075_06645 [Methylobacterium currus]|uniref:Uncharacterized protein n=1 Tax=Methylobacterium currus TaxID=2051553 RepID=A0A2R4WGH6_9HYPH|nr:hypothetical protein [Methylobacterium currus]AWB20642.1 hypothetical protein DA075_06645 [Methylobacterium currus]
MSREFRYVGSGYFHSVLDDAANPEGGGRHEITKLLSELYGALAPLEYDSASYEASDAGPERVVLGLQENWTRIEAAMMKLKHVYQRDRDLIQAVIREMNRL